MLQEAGPLDAIILRFARCQGIDSIMFAASRTLLITAISAAFLSACNDQSTSSPSSASASDKPAATVNGVAVPESQVALLLKHLGSQEQPQLTAADGRKMVLEQLTMQSLLSQQAVKDGLDKQPEIRDQLELARQSVLSNAYVQKLAQADNFSEADVKAEYEKIKQQLGGSEYKARHILVDDEALAQDIIAKLKANPKSFAALAKQYSKDPGSTERGGDLGWFNPASMVAEFAAALKDLQAGQTTSAPVKTQYGYHIINVEDTRSRMLPSLEEIEPMVRQQMQQQRIKKHLAELKDKARIEITPQAEADHAETKPAAPADDAHASHQHDSSPTDKAQ